MAHAARTRIGAGRVASWAMTGWERPSTGRPRRVAAIIALLMVVAAGAALALTRTTERTVPLEIVGEHVPAPASEVGWPTAQPGAWRRVPAVPLRPRAGAAVVSTGDTALVWGGIDWRDRPQFDGAAFDPRAGEWRPLPMTSAREAVTVAVLAGDEVVFVAPSDTRRYDHAQRRWRAAPAPPVPPRHGLSEHVVAVADTVVAVTAPRTPGSPSAVLALRVGADAWRRLPDVPVPIGPAHVVLGADGQLLVIGPAHDGGDTAVALDIDDVAGGWRALDDAPDLPHDLMSLAGAAGGDHIMLWGMRADSTAGTHGFAALRDGRTWHRIAPGPLAPARAASVLWSGQRFVVWSDTADAGAFLDPGTERWTPLPAPPPVDESQRPRAAVWTDAGLFVWGAQGAGGALYTPP